LGPTVGIFVDYESPLARVVAGSLWSGLSAAALGAGYTRITALWESLREARGSSKLEGPLLHVFVVGQDRPDAVDTVAPVGEPGAAHLYGMVVAVPERPSPLSGSLLYQGVEKLTGGGVRAGFVEPAPLRASPGECELYARRLLGRLGKVRKGP
jgi:hypothetical protein